MDPPAMDFHSGHYNSNYGRTPPQFTPSSYEARHFGKRARAGSISGRLRSASDLEDKGFISKAQKGLIKDLIISGDQALQKALDGYEAGDVAELESMIRNGKLDHRNSIDVLDDLDLDFLCVSMGDGHSEGVSMGGRQQRQLKPEADMRPPYDGVDEVDNIVTPSSDHGSVHGRGGGLGPLDDAHILPHEDDGIGELDFNEMIHHNREQRTNSLGFGFGPLVDDSDQLAGGGREKINKSTDKDKGRSFREAAALASANRRRTSSFSQSLDQKSWTNFSNSLHGVPNTERERRTSSSGSFMNLDFQSASFGAGWMDGLAAVPSSSVGGGADYGNSARGRVGGIGGMLLDAEYGGQNGQGGGGGGAGSGAGGAGGGRVKTKKQQDKEKKKEMKKSAGAKKSQSSSPKKLGKKKQSSSEDAAHGRPQSMCSPNISMDEEYEAPQRPEGWVGAYSPDARKVRIDRFLVKRQARVWTKKVKYDVRKNFADSRMRVKGRFVKKEDEVLMRELMSLT